MVVQRENRLESARIMNGRQIFLAELAQGAIGEENAYLLATLLVSKLRQTAQIQLERVRFPASEELFAFLAEHDLPQPSEGEVRGYKVTVDYEAVSPVERAARLKGIGAVIRAAWPRLAELDRLATV